MHFYMSRAALNEITDEHGAPRIDTLTWERGVIDPTVWHLGQALLPALERPHEIGAMYADHLLMATHTYFAVAFGGMRLTAHSRRGGLAPWQVRCATVDLAPPARDSASVDEKSKNAPSSLICRCRQPTCSLRRAVCARPRARMICPRVHEPCIL